MDTKNISSVAQWYVMIYCIECCTQIEKNQDQNVVRIITVQKIVKDMKQGCLGTVLHSICQLKSVPQIVVFEVCKQLGKDIFSSTVLVQKAGLIQAWTFWICWYQLRDIGGGGGGQWPVSTNLAQNL